MVIESPTLIKELLADLRAGKTLSESQAFDAFESILTGRFDEPQIAAFLAIIAYRGPTVDELVGGARVMRSFVTPVTLPDNLPEPLRVIDTCGTGGAPKTFNVSTAAAFVVAAAHHAPAPRVVVAKHGSTSRTNRGSAELLKSLGVNIDASPDTQARCLAQLGVCFSFSVNHHPAMKHAAAARKSLGFPTIFNLLGPLTNPARAQRQLIGAFSRDLALKLAHTLARLGAEHALVVHSHDGLDELSTTTTNLTLDIRDGAVAERIIDPLPLGLPRAELREIQSDSIEHAAQVFLSVLDNEPSPFLDMVLLNAAGALVVADVAPTFAQALSIARAAIESGRVRALFDRFVRISQAA